MQEMQRHHHIFTQVQSSRACTWLPRYHESLFDNPVFLSGYDRASNRTWRKDPVAESFSKHFDELYAYDGLHRLKDMQRGELNSGKTAITNETFAQCWSLDATGNWSGMREADTGGAWTLEQSRTANPVNEIASITNAVGPAWAQPAYEPAGNMTTIPKPKDPTKEFTATYDAWNRLTKLEEFDGNEGLQTVQENQYDARRFRIVQKNYEEGTLTETRHDYYNTGWQNLEERLGTDPDEATPNRQYVWGQRYIDDCILRDRGTDADGTLDERLYALQDGNWNVIAIADPSGNIPERYAYAAYGTATFLSATFTERSSSDFVWEVLFAGYPFDQTSSLANVRNRVLAAQLGVWTQRDPLHYVADLSAYAYVASVPTSFIDPLGLQAEQSDLQKKLPEECRDLLKPAEDGACRIIIFAGHHVPEGIERENFLVGFAGSLTRDWGINVPGGNLREVDEIDGWFQELKEAYGEPGLPCGTAVGGVGCFPGLIVERQEKRFGKDKVIKDHPTELFLPGKKLKPVVEPKGFLAKQYSVQLLKDVVVKAREDAQRLCDQRTSGGRCCKKVKIEVCCSTSFKKVVEAENPKSPLSKLCDRSSRPQWKHPTSWNEKECK